MIGRREYRNQFTPMRDAPGLVSIVLRSSDIAVGKNKMRHSINPHVSDEYVIAQVKASCMCANSIIKDLLAKTRPPKVYYTDETTILGPMPTYPRAVIPRAQNQRGSPDSAKRMFQALQALGRNPGLIPSYVDDKTGVRYVGHPGESLASLIARTQPQPRSDK